MVLYTNVQWRASFRTATFTLSVNDHDPPLLRSIDRAWFLPAVSQGVRRCSDTQFQYLFLLIILLLGIWVSLAMGSKLISGGLFHEDETDKATLQFQWLTHGIKLWLSLCHSTAWTAVWLALTQPTIWKASYNHQQRNHFFPRWEAILLRSNQLSWRNYQIYRMQASSHTLCSMGLTSESRMTLLRHQFSLHATMPWHLRPTKEILQRRQLVISEAQVSLKGDH